MAEDPSVGPAGSSTPHLREVYPFYEFDVAQGVVRYKKNEADQWISYKPTAAEVARARAYFND